MYETVTLGRAKRSTAGNRMRELLEKAHQENVDDALFAEDEDDVDFEEPREIKDVFLDEFADTDEEVDDDETEENEIRRAERRQSEIKGKSKVGFNPLIKNVKAPNQSTTQPPTDALTLLDPSIDPSAMAPSTLVLAIRKQRREAKRLNRSETRRSTMRASTLKTEVNLIEKERQEKLALLSSRKGRRAQHETGEVRGARPMTQDELIAAALEEEERNKEALTDWLRREEERRELRRVGRKRVRGPRWTWISRTVGRLVDEVNEQDGHKLTKGDESLVPHGDEPSTERGNETRAASLPPNDLTKAAPVASEGPGAEILTSPDVSGQLAPYMRNYFILSQVQGGLTEELRLILGDHVDWSDVKVIPPRNRPINRRSPVDILTGGIGRYRHPRVMLPYSGCESFANIEALLKHRFVWSSAGFWAGGEADMPADGIADVSGWRDVAASGWLAGERYAVNTSGDESRQPQSEPKESTHVSLKPIKKTSRK